MIQELIEISLFLFHYTSDPQRNTNLQAGSILDIAGMSAFF